MRRVKPGLDSMSAYRLTSDVARKGNLVRFVPLTDIELFIRSCNGLGSFTRRNLLRERLLVGLGDEIELRTALRSKPVASRSANLDEDTQENEGNGTHSEPNAAHSLDGMNCINK